MTDTPQDPTPTRETPPVSSQGVKDLLESLVGIASARVVPREDGGVEEVHVLALPGTTTEGVTRSVISALRARFDVKVEASRIFVARIQGADPPPSPPRSGDVGRAGSGPAPIHLSGTALREDVGPPPWPERAPRGDEPDAGSATSSGRRIAGERAETLESRFLFLGHRTSKRRFKAVEVAVDLQWRGRRHRGAASVRDMPSDRLEAPALATLRALDAALEGRPRDDHTREVDLTLRGVEIVEALGERHIMVSILARLGHMTTPLTGTVVVDDSVELATILATLQATDRRVRAVLLDHLPGNGGPPERP